MSIGEAVGRRRGGVVATALIACTLAVLPAAGADPVQAPPRGTYAAITDEAIPDTLILYQDVALEAGYNHRLSLLAYHRRWQHRGNHRI